MLVALGLVAALVAVGAGVAAWARRRWILVTVRGDSMAPTLRDGQQLLARRRDPSHPGPARSEIVVFRLPAERRAAMEELGLPYLVKRVAAVAGDPVPEWAWEKVGADARTRVPPGRVVVSGDNARSQDSRQLGYIDVGDVIAVVRPPGA